MEEKKITVVSKCCESGVYMIPSAFSLGNETLCYCARCSKECETKVKEETLNENKNDKRRNG